MTRILSSWTTMARTWVIVVVALVLNLVMGRVDPSMRASAVPNDVLSNFERRNGIRKETLRKEMLFELRCGDTVLPTSNGDVEVVLKRVEPMFDMIAEGEKVDLESLELLPLYRGIGKGSAGSTRLTMQCTRDGFLNHVHITKNGIHTGSLQPLHENYPHIVAFVKPGSYETPKMGDEIALNQTRHSADDIIREGKQTHSETAGGRIDDDLSVPMDALGPHVQRQSSELRHVQVGVMFGMSLCVREGSMGRTASFIHHILETVSTTIYEPIFGLRLVITLVAGWCDHDPYEEDDPQTCKDYQVRVQYIWEAHTDEWFHQYKRDIGMFMFNKEFKTSDAREKSVNGCAGQSGACTYKGIAVTNMFQLEKFHESVEPEPEDIGKATFAKQTFVVAHEFCHLLGGFHHKDEKELGLMHRWTPLLVEEKNWRIIREVKIQVNTFVSFMHRCFPVNGDCTNIATGEPESNCACETGWESLNGAECLDYDECAEDSERFCGGNECVNRDGDYWCAQRCKENYTPDENNVCRWNKCLARPCGTDFDCELDSERNRNCICGPDCVRSRASGQLTCNCDPQCKRRNRSCSEDADCCSFFCKPCVEEGGACKRNRDCCSGKCKFWNRTCKGSG